MIKPKSALLTADVQVSVQAEDLRDPLVADHLSGTVPRSFIDVEGRPEAAPAPEGGEKPPLVLTLEQELKRGHELLDTACARDPSQMPAFLDWVLGMAMASYGVDTRQVKVPMPYNQGYVRSGGFSVLRTRSIKEHAVMDVNMAALGEQLGHAERFRMLREKVQPVAEILAANESVPLNQVATMVTAGLDRGQSVIAKNADLLRVLQPALTIRGKPAQDGKDTRAETERNEERLTSAVAAAAAASESRPEPQATRLVAEVPAPPLVVQPKIPPRK